MLLVFDDDDDDVKDVTHTKKLSKQVFCLLTCKKRCKNYDICADYAMVSRKKVASI